MTIALHRLHPHFGAEVLGVNPTAPVDGETFGRILDAFNEYSVLVFRDQPLTDAQQIAFSRRFGPLEQTIKHIATNETIAREIADLSNVDLSGRMIPPGSANGSMRAAMLTPSPCT